MGRRFRGSEPSTSVQPVGPRCGTPFPPRGPGRSVPPPRRYDEVLRLPGRPSRLARLPSLGDTIQCVAVRSHRSGRAAGGHGVRDPVPEPDWRMEATGSLRFLGTPRVPWPRSSTPPGPRGSGHRDPPARPPLCPRRRLPHGRFRGSIARPWDWLSTLRSEDRSSPRKTRFRLLAKLCRAGFVVDPQGSDERFGVSSSSSFPKLS